MPSVKRMRHPKITTQALLDFDLGESSSDSDFRIEDHNFSDGSKDGGNCDSSEETSSDSDTDDDSEDESDVAALNLEDKEESYKPLINGNTGHENFTDKLKEFTRKSEEAYTSAIKPMCCVCLGERSDDSNEIIECDGCGFSVHEGCYGVSDNMSISSTNSTCSTEPWFCEACRSGVSDPTCELCPNKGGIYKETDVGKWVHLICALYVPGVAFGEVEQLSSVTLFEMTWNKWGAKICSLCENSLLAQTGVCIGCDAGMCKTYFHVTCAQAAGFLIEAHHEDADAADPFYAHCKVHSEKEMIKRRKRNYHTLRMNMQRKISERLTFKVDDPSPAQMRIHRKLLKIQRKYCLQKHLKPDPWVPTQKMSRLLTTSASACKRLMSKAANMSIDVEFMERQHTQIAALTDVRKKWHIAPAFSVEFVAYYLDRIARVDDIKQQLDDMMNNNSRLRNQQNLLRTDYDESLEDLKTLKVERDIIIAAIKSIHNTISMLNPNKILPNPETIGRPNPESPKEYIPPQRPISVPTAAALKMGVGFPLVHLGPPGTIVDSARLLSTQAKNSPNSANISASNFQINSPLQICGICKFCSDQHLLAKCDTCTFYYHLRCLNPPLTRHPKKSKQYGWQCSECCDKSDVSDVKEHFHGRRKSRIRYSQEGVELSVEKKESYRESNLSRKEFLDVTVSRVASSSPDQKLFNQSSQENEVNSCSEENELKKRTLNLVVHSPKNSTLNFSLSTSSIVDSKHGAGELSVYTGDATFTEEIIDACLDPLALPKCNNANTAIPAVEASIDTNDKLLRKLKRKEKHKNKHNSSSDTEKSPNKEHKRKRKKRYDQSSEIMDTSIPKIKIKFKTLPLPGEDTPEAQFFYVSADTVRSAEEASRPTSVETVEEHKQQETLQPRLDNIAKEFLDTIPKTSPVRKITTKKSSLQKQRPGRPRSASAIQKIEIKCCVCKDIGKTNQVVTCDDCRKHYHFTCLDPPLKKTPKIRGYSWHCAECDPTEDEHK